MLATTILVLIHQNTFNSHTKIVSQNISVLIHGECVYGWYRAAVAEEAIALFSPIPAIY
jgi:hypothetical protein